MPKIHLKPNSPEFEDYQPRPQEKTCDMPGCDRTGEFRAPKDRNLSEYYCFCQTHTAEYNKAWNYFADMTPEEMQAHLRESVYGHRPTWKNGNTADYVDELYRKAWQTYNNTEEEPPNERDEFFKEQKKKEERYRRTGEEFTRENTPEVEAMEIMGLEPPLTLTGIKKRYKELAKQYHPDINAGDKEAEEQLKSVNMAYTILKVAYEKYEKMEER